ncbi:hypothetical protein [Methanoregula sp.]
MILPAGGRRSGAWNRHLGRGAVGVGAEDHGAGPGEAAWRP